MWHYRYLCIDKKEQYFTGDVFAGETLDLAKQLEKFEFVLISYQRLYDDQEFKSGAAIPAPKRISKADADLIHAEHLIEMGKEPPPTKAPLEIRLEENLKNSLNPLTSRLFAAAWTNRSKVAQTSMLAVAVLIGIWLGVKAGSWWVHREPDIPDEMIVIYPKMHSIQKNMTREEVEKIFITRAQGVQLSTMTRYSEGPWLLEVYYDQEGGDWNNNNHLLGMMLKKKQPMMPVTGQTQSTDNAH